MKNRNIFLTGLMYILPHNILRAEIITDLRLFSSNAVFFNVRLLYVCSNASMNEFMCSEHSVRIRRSEKTQHWKSTLTLTI